MLEDSLVGYMFSNNIIAVKIIFNGNIIRKKNVGQTLHPANLCSRRLKTANRRQNLLAEDRHHQVPS